MKSMRFPCGLGNKILTDCPVNAIVLAVDFGSDAVQHGYRGCNGFWIHFRRQFDGTILSLNKTRAVPRFYASHRF